MIAMGEVRGEEKAVNGIRYI